MPSRFLTTVIRGSRSVISSTSTRFFNNGLNFMPTSSEVSDAKGLALKEGSSRTANPAIRTPSLGMIVRRISFSSILRFNASSMIGRYWAW